MNAPPKLDRYTLNLAKAKALHEASGNLLAALTRSGGKYSTAAIWAEIATYEAVDTLSDSDSMAEAIANLRSELPDDTEADEFDASARHPDHPGGW